MADMATHWRHTTARPMVTVAELLGRVAAVPRGSACGPAVCQHEPGVSVDALLRRENRATPAQDRAAPGQARRAAVAVSTFLAAGSVVGAALSSNTAEYQLGTTAQPVDAPPVGQSAPAATGEQNLVPGEQAPVLDIPASAGGLAAGTEPPADWTALAFPPTAGSSAGEASVGSAETPSPSTNAAAASDDEESQADAESRGDDDDSGSDDDGDRDTRSSESGSRDSESTSTGSTSRDDEVVLADGGSAEPTPARSEALVPAGGAPADTAGDDTASDDGDASVDDSDGADTPPAASDSTDEGSGAVDGSDGSTESDSSADKATADSDAGSDSSSADESDNGTDASDDDSDAPATESAA